MSLIVINTRRRLRNWMSQKILFVELDTKSV